MSQLWKVETSHLVNHPPEYEAFDHFDLYRQVQTTADARKAVPGRLPFGQLEFRAEEVEGEVRVIHAYFRGKDKKRRFMRLRRVG